MKYCKDSPVMYSPVVEHCEYRQRKVAKDGVIMVQIDLEPVRYEADSSLHVRDFVVSTLIAAENFDSFKPVRLPDNDQFTSISNASKFDKFAAAAVNLSKRLSND